MKTPAQRIAYIEATLNRLARDRNYTKADAASDIERVWAEDVQDNRDDARLDGAFVQSFYGEN